MTVQGFLGKYFLNNLNPTLMEQVIITLTLILLLVLAVKH